jgi:catechol 2,3-dioxygenase-like lactoylglutathione lyase family enzyme
MENTAMTAIKLNSISGITCSVKDLGRTAEFYGALGFRRGNSADGRLTCYVNWFWITFVEQDGDGALVADNGQGLATCIKVDSADETYQALLAAGLKPDGEPGKRASGNREFTLRDPDGYQLIFFSKK